MFFPLFIAILLGLVSPSDTNTNSSYHSGTTVSVNSNSTNSEEGIPGEGIPGDDTGGGPGGGPTTGENGQILPPKP